MISSYLMHYAYLAFLLLFIFWGIKSSKYNGWQDRNFQVLIYAALILATSQVVVTTLKHMSFSMDESMAFFFKRTETSWRGLFLLPHIITGACSTFLGPVLFYRPFRNSNLSLHRKIGKIYVYGTLISAILVLPLSTTNAGGLIPQIGFTTMAVLWIVFTLLALRTAMKGDIESHRKWMFRSYAMTFAFVNVNFTFKILNAYQLLELNDLGVKIMQSYVSWIMNLIIVEIYLFCSSTSGKLLRPEKLRAKFQLIFSPRKKTKA